MGLSRAGSIAAAEWQRIPQIRPYVRLDAWIVMPNRPEGDSRSESGVNHVHGIMGITTESPGHHAANLNSDKSLDDNDVEMSRRDVSTHENEDESTKEPRLQAHPVGAIVGQYKSVCTKRIRATCRPDFGWQSRYYDRILRDRHELKAARRYILQNPITWAEDRRFEPA